jgi:hypothetical protein
MLNKGIFKKKTEKRLNPSRDYTGAERQASQQLEKMLCAAAGARKFILERWNSRIN